MGLLGWLLILDGALTVLLGVLGLIGGFFLAFLAASVSVLLLLILYGTCQLGWRDGNQVHFIRFFIFLTKRPIADWMLALAVGWSAGALAMIAAWSVDGENWNQQAPEAVGAFLTGFTATIAVNVLYRSYAPIEDVEELLRRLVDDMNDLTTLGGDLWLVFPALSLGAYRAINEDGSHAASPFWLFQQKLEECTGSSRVRVRLVTLDQPLSHRLFEHYHEQQCASRSPPPMQSDRKLFAWKQVEERMRQVSGKVHTRLINLDPAVLTNLFIIAGNVTYAIHAHGLPYYKRGAHDDLTQSSWGGDFFSASPGLAELVAYRRQDPGLAKDATRQLTEWIDGLRASQHLTKVVLERDQ